MHELKRNIDIGLILIISFALRFTVSITHSYTNDELSAINRLRYDTFSELIDQGVKTGDMHPAGVQVFEKIWSSLFGTSELALRFPFVLFGTLSVWMIFLIGKNWFNRTTGIFAAIFLGFLYFPIIQSELARPYSPGLLITLLVVWFYNKILFTSLTKKEKIKFTFALGFCFAAGLYTHYFLFYTLIVIGVSGFVFFNRTNWKNYLLATLLAIVLYIPHVPITLHHLSVGGLGWLGEPDPLFIFDFIFYAFNQSLLILLGVLILILISFFFSEQTEKISAKYYWLSAYFFFGVVLGGYLISYLVTPVLKIPVLIFVFPFLLLMISALLSRLKGTIYFASAMGLLILFSSLAEQKLFDTRHMGYRETAKHLVEWNKKYGDENIYAVYNLSNPDYMNFYATQFGDSVYFERNLIEFSDAPQVRRDLALRDEPYCVVGYSERLTLPQIFEIVQEFYPLIIESFHYENSAVFLMKRNDQLERSNELTQPGKKLISEFLFESGGQDKWTYKMNFLKTDSITKSLIYKLNADNMYGPDFVIRKNEMNQNMVSYIKVEIEAAIPDDAQLTIGISAMRNGQFVQHQNENWWLGYDLEEMILSTQDSVTGIGKSYFAFNLPIFIEPDDELKFSLWNRNGKEIKIFKFKIVLVEDVWSDHLHQ
ncbi:MAG: glycosyltransferase family 39 protein [Crocinitomicaceae bacterium]|nr:glycosyltransferase family 39 protein [Crocinitomicaceae bacterium]MBK8924882.1 glycosyltransferase family 39 protein [Crocinitomicaceae bacterium]